MRDRRENCMGCRDMCHTLKDCIVNNQTRQRLSNHEPLTTSTNYHELQFIDLCIEHRVHGTKISEPQDLDHHHTNEQTRGRARVSQAPAKSRAHIRFSLCSKHRTHITSAFRSQPCEATLNTKKKKEKQGTQKQDIACISPRRQYDLRLQHVLLLCCVKEVADTFHTYCNLVGGASDSFIIIPCFLNSTQPREEI